MHRLDTRFVVTTALLAGVLRAVEAGALKAFKASDLYRDLDAALASLEGEEDEQ